MLPFYRAHKWVSISFLYKSVGRERVAYRLGHYVNMTINDAEAARLAASNHFMAAGYGPAISIDLARRYTDEGGTAILSTGGVPLLTLPSGIGVHAWLEALKSDSTAEHLFAPVAPPAPAAPVQPKPVIDKTETADSKLARANGHAPLRPNRPASKA